MLQHYPIFLNVGNVPKDPYEVDEINQHFLIQLQIFNYTICFQQALHAFCSE
jgi:hypothetical protein